MRRRKAPCCGSRAVRLGTLLAFAGLCLALWNVSDSIRAGAAAESAVQALAAATAQPVEAGRGELPVAQVNGRAYIGVLEIPGLNLTLPVLRDCSAQDLRLAPCRYTGSPDGHLVLAGHNYRSHFGRLNRLHPGDEIHFTSADGTQYHYAVETLEQLPPESSAQMTAGAWDLTLFTCTWDGGSRLAVRCVCI